MSDVIPYLGFPGGSVEKNPPANEEMWVPTLGQEDPLEKEMATHSSNFAWRIPWTEEPGELQSMGLQRSWTRLSTHALPWVDCFNDCFFLPSFLPSFSSSLSFPLSFSVSVSKGIKYSLNGTKEKMIIS